MAADGHTEDGKGKSQHLPKTERECAREHMQEKGKEQS